MFFFFLNKVGIIECMTELETNFWEASCGDIGALRRDTEEGTRMQCIHIVDMCVLCWLWARPKSCHFFLCLMDV